MKLKIVVVGAWMVCLCGNCLMAQDTQEQADIPKITAEKPMSFWMKKKLEFSQDMLEALTSGDFKTIEQKARQMNFVGKLEGFARVANVRYTAQLHMFDMSTGELVAQARNKNIQGATLAFNQMTTSCVACHMDLRKDSK